MTPESGVTVIVNPMASRVRARGVLKKLANEFRGLGADPEFIISPSSLAPSELARAAYHRGRRVVACGGDGLIGQIARVAAACDGEMAVLPYGSGNDFARELGIDTNKPLNAVKTALFGEITTVDLGFVTDDLGTERPFCSVAGTGFDAAAAVWASDKAWPTGTPLYVAAVLRTLANYRPRAYRLRIDGEEIELKAWLIAFANGRYYGGGMAIAPQADCRDGVIDVVVIGPVSRAGFLGAFPRVFSGSHLSHPHVQTYSGREIRVEAAEGDTPAAIVADGELAAWLPVTITLQSLRLKVLASPHRQGSNI